MRSLGHPELPLTYVKRVGVTVGAACAIRKKLSEFMDFRHLGLDHFGGRTRHVEGNANHLPIHAISLASLPGFCTQHTSCEGHWTKPRCPVYGLGKDMGGSSQFLPCFFWGSQTKGNVFLGKSS